MTEEGTSMPPLQATAPETLATNTLSYPGRVEITQMHSETKNVPVNVGDSSTPIMPQIRNNEGATAHEHFGYSMRATETAPESTATSIPVVGHSEEHHLELKPEARQEDNSEQVNEKLRALLEGLNHVNQLADELGQLLG